MKLGTVVQLRGGQAQDAAAALVERLGETGRPASQDGERVVFDALPQARPADGTLLIDLDPHDPPGFAAEKVLDTLEERGWVVLDGFSVSPQEEAAIEDRLKRLGYLE